MAYVAKGLGTALAEGLIGFQKAANEREELERKKKMEEEDRARAKELHSWAQREQTQKQALDEAVAGAASEVDTAQNTPSLATYNLTADERAELEAGQGLASVSPTTASAMRQVSMPAPMSETERQMAITKRAAGLAAAKGASASAVLGLQEKAGVLADKIEKERREAIERKRTESNKRFGMAILQGQATNDWTELERASKNLIDEDGNRYSMDLKGFDPKTGTFTIHQNGKIYKLPGALFASMPSMPEVVVDNVQKAIQAIDHAESTRNNAFIAARGAAESILVLPREYANAAYRQALLDGKPEPEAQKIKAAAFKEGLANMQRMPIGGMAQRASNETIDNMQEQIRSNDSKIKANNELLNSFRYKNPKSKEDQDEKARMLEENARLRRENAGRKQQIDGILKEHGFGADADPSGNPFAGFGPGLGPALPGEGWKVVPPPPKPN